MKIPGLILAMVMAAAALYGDVNVYLFPRVDSGRNALTLSDLGRIDGDTEAAAVRPIVIDEALFADGYVDRKELSDLIRARVSGRVNIYGSGVRVNVIEHTAAEDRSGIAVRKGSPVRFQVVTSRIRVEQNGTALQDGAVGEEIPVKLKGQAVSRGRIVNERVVELAL